MREVTDSLQLAAGHPVAVVVAGGAGAGKSTAGASITAALRAAGRSAVLLDLDPLGGPLVAAVAAAAGLDPDDLDAPDLRDLTRGPRYETLLIAAEAALSAGADCVLVAPFTAERRDRDRWGALSGRLGGAGAAETLLVLATCPPDVRAARLVARGAARDRARLADPVALVARLAAEDLADRGDGPERVMLETGVGA